MLTTPLELVFDGRWVIGLVPCQARCGGFLEKTRASATLFSFFYRAQRRDLNRGDRMRQRWVICRPGQASKQRMGERCTVDPCDRKPSHEQRALAEGSVGQRALAAWPGRQS